MQVQIDVLDVLMHSIRAYAEFEADKARDRVRKSGQRIWFERDNKNIVPLR